MIRGRDPILTLVLAGIAVAALVGAGILLIKILADPYDRQSIRDRRTKWCG